MKRIPIGDIWEKSEQLGGSEITVCGWVKSVRAGASVAFITLNDGSDIRDLQIVFEKEKYERYSEISAIGVGAAIQACGTLLLTPESRQPFELQGTDFEVLGESTPDYPLQKKHHTREFMRTIAHLRPRAALFKALYRLRSGLAFGAHSFFHENGFVYIHSPIITTSDAEGAGEMFAVTAGEGDFFGKPASLTVSGQLEAECMATALGKVYTFGPTSRAENSNTQRHASEFWMIEPEIAFADLSENMDICEAFIKYEAKFVLDNYLPELQFLSNLNKVDLIARAEHIVNSDFVRVSYTEAIKILQESGENFAYQPEYGSDLATEHERYLTEKAFSAPVFVTDWPRDIKAFYMRVNDDGKTVAAVDLLMPGVGELCGGSQREERPEILKEQIEKFGLKPENYTWYCDLRKYGSVKHSGFGVGFDRLVMYMSGEENIRDVLPFPRTPGNAEF